MPMEPIPVVGDAGITMPPPQFEVQLDVFSGPLELLLQLIESRQLDVLTVSLADLADGYVAHLASRPVPTEQLAEFVSIASQLILIKSRRMLPGDTGPERRHGRRRTRRGGAAPTADRVPDRARCVPRAWRP